MTLHHQSRSVTMLPRGVNASSVVRMEVAVNLDTWNFLFRQDEGQQPYVHENAEFRLKHTKTSCRGPSPPQLVTSKWTAARRRPYLQKSFGLYSENRGPISTSGSDTVNLSPVGKQQINFQVFRSGSRER